LVPESFYYPDGDRYAATELTRGPWDPGAQHAGPPAALIAREMEGLPAEKPRQLCRVTYEILRPIPIAALRVEAEIVRPGRSVELVEASLADDRGPVVRARGWRIRSTDVDVPGEIGSAGMGAGSGSVLGREDLPGPAEGSDAGFFPTGQDVGYHTAMDYRFVRGAFTEPGPATAWMRMRQALVAGEEPSPFQRVACAGDTGNGISAPLDYRRFIFINVDLTIHVVRPPEGEWVCLESVTVPERTGVGLTDTALHDERGPIGRAAQTLLIAERGA
jgi:acyl-Coa thioesterase superfamily protein/acyl-CoA thioesterase superfamily protein